MSRPFSLNTQGKLRLDLSGVWSVKDFVDFLDKLRDTYAMLLSFIPSSEEVRTIRDGSFLKPQTYPSFLFPWGGVEIKHQDGRILTFPEIVFEALKTNAESLTKLFSNRLNVFDDLIVNSISIQSPGWVEVIGRLNPLQAINDILVIIRDWQLQKDRGRFENMILESEAFRLRIEMLRTAGFPDQQIQQYVQIWLTPGTHFLHDATQRNQITSFSCASYPDNIGSSGPVIPEQGAAQEQPVVAPPEEKPRVRRRNLRSKPDETNTS